jgi:hypothetical protein
MVASHHCKTRVRRTKLLESYRMRPAISCFGLLLGLVTAAGDTADLPLVPGLYRIEVRISLPNVQDTAAPLMFTQCVDLVDLQSGRAFFVRSDNPLKECDLLDYQVHAETAVYNIACHGPNKGSATAAFDTTGSTYRGSIKMNLGGKNITMSETQANRRLPLRRPSHVASWKMTLSV